MFANKTAAKPLRRIPILLLKTRTTPHDAYEEYFSRSTHDELLLEPAFVPVLEHRQNEETLSDLAQLLRRGRMKEQYGGMIFTSQRAVEAWATTVQNPEIDSQATTHIDSSSALNVAHDAHTSTAFHTDILQTTSFPLYAVGPATHSLLSALLSTLSPTHPFLTLTPSLHGSHTGSGAVLAPFILQHYNAIHTNKQFTYHDAPRLPFIPLLGMGSENYSRKRLESSDWRLEKKPLLFLVGEQRRDVIPRMLMDKNLGTEKVEVVEKEVYQTVVKDGFRRDLRQVLGGLHGGEIVVVVVFSPQGAREMLEELGLIDDGNRTQQLAKTTRYIIVTIGPTTRDYLRDTCGFEPDVCAKTPSPQGVGDGIGEFLRSEALGTR